MVKSPFFPNSICIELINKTLFILGVPKYFSCPFSGVSHRVLQIRMSFELEVPLEGLTEHAACLGVRNNDSVVPSLDRYWCLAELAELVAIGEERFHSQVSADSRMVAKGRFFEGREELDNQK